MTDPTGLDKVADGLAKLGDSKLANKAYDDLLTTPMQETGKGLTDLVKSFRLFLAPFQLLALAQDRLAAFCDGVRAKVPEDRQQQAAPSIAGPILLNLRFMEDENPLTDLYLNLLARAVDKERCQEAHPAFVRIIEQISPDEAMVIYMMRDRQVHLDFRAKEGVKEPILTWGNTKVTGTDFPLESLASPKLLAMYLKRLESFTLVSYTYEVASVTGYSPHQGHHYYLTEFGRLFLQACIPDEFSLRTDSSDNRT